MFKNGNLLNLGIVSNIFIIRRLCNSFQGFLACFTGTISKPGLKRLTSNKYAIDMRLCGQERTKTRLNSHKLTYNSVTY